MRTMYWFNEPINWQPEGDSLTMNVTPKTDYWRKTHYGFTVDDGPFYYCEVGGEFETKVKISADFRNRYDQLGLMLRIDQNTWIKTGIEYVNDKINVSAVVTHNTSDWSVTELDDMPEFLWFKAIRQLDSVEIFFSRDDVNYSMIRLAHFPDNIPVKVGLMAACPDGDGFEAKFEHFQFTHLPDSRRLKWLEQN